ncbi:MAG: hypothetical protein ACRD0N_04975 [Acidimicrobiales bacterium]
MPAGLDVPPYFDGPVRRRTAPRLGALERGGFRTALIVSHRVYALGRADPVVVLDEGRVVASS